MEKKEIIYVHPFGENYYSTIRICVSGCVDSSVRSSVGVNISKVFFVRWPCRASSRAMSDDDIAQNPMKTLRALDRQNVFRVHARGPVVAVVVAQGLTGPLI